MTTAAINAMKAYRKYLIDMGSPAKAAVVAHCIELVKRLTK